MHMLVMHKKTEAVNKLFFNKVYRVTVNDFLSLALKTGVFRINRVLQCTGFS